MSGWGGRGLSRGNWISQYLNYYTCLYWVLHFDGARKRLYVFSPNISSIFLSSIFHFMQTNVYFAINWYVFHHGGSLSRWATTMFFFFFVLAVGLAGSVMWCWYKRRGLEWWRCHNVKRDQHQRIRLNFWVLRLDWDSDLFWGFHLFFFFRFCYRCGKMLHVMDYRFMVCLLRS